MIFLRIAGGIRAHFYDRAPEWVMAGTSLGMAVAFALQPDLFDRAPHYVVVRSWAEESTWALLVALSGGFRVLALGVNGTFDAFKWSPQLRMAGAMFGAAFFGLWWWGFLVCAIERGTSLGPVVSYGGLAALEFVNLYRSSPEVGAKLRMRSLKGG